MSITAGPAPRGIPASSLPCMRDSECRPPWAQPTIATESVVSAQPFLGGGCKSFMTIALKPQHLERYKQIAKLLFRYGRGDLARDAELDPDHLNGKNGPDSSTLTEEAPASAPAGQLASDLEAMGPT